MPADGFVELHGNTTKHADSHTRAPCRGDAVHIHVVEVKDEGCRPTCKSALRLYAETVESFRVLSSVILGSVVLNSAYTVYLLAWRQMRGQALTTWGL
ncbi:hypothetical protein UVI_02032630 [Ustilaginoidea virens]|uniref:Uncharacterized protein n=1 Tax=Ustilaginoidea virens TaxID=1159556 RepID=A0A1B5KUA6_USTVR|nr:hypothetical protein UVI_02032630 [Ustilaginoidea virens]